MKKKKSLGKDIIEGLQEAIEYEKGNKKAKVTKMKIHKCQYPNCSSNKVFVNIDDINTDLAITLSKYVHNNCRNVSDDIGLHLQQIVYDHCLQSIQKLGIQGEKLK